MTLPLITSAPHDAQTFAEFENRIAFSPWQKGEFSDRYTANTAYHPYALGNLKSVVSRGLGSLNQPRDHSLFKLKDFHGNTIWKEGQHLTEEEKEYCFKKYHDPYYEKIRQLIRRSRNLGFEKVIFWDHHDTGDFDERTGKRDRKLPNEERSMPKFILSNLGQSGSGELNSEAGYISCPPDFIQNIKTVIADEFELNKTDVEINTSYTGGNLLQYFGNPDNDFGNTVVGIQIEYNRGFIMDQATREPYWDKIMEFNQKFNKVMEKACQLLGDIKT